MKQVFESKLVEGSEVVFPKYAGERVYMLPFYQKQGLPENLKHWQKTVDQMLQGVQTKEKIYLMIDQSFVKRGTPQRRPGVHIDGYWNEAEGKHGSHGGHKSKLSASQGGHGSHKPKLAQKLENDIWEEADFDSAEAIILASNISASRGFIGSYNGPINHMGQCEHIDLSELKEVILEANKVYSGNVTFLHESLPVDQDCYRTLVRLNVPGLELK